jgi:hypothetical protein
MLHTAAIVALQLAGMGSGPARTGQSPCPSCTLDVAHIVTIGHVSDSFGVGGTDILVRDSRGRYYTAHNDDPATVSVFHPNGRAWRKIGRRGRGPGEYRNIVALHMAPGDTLHVFDAGNQRHTILSPSYEVVATRPMPGKVQPDGVRLLDGGALVINGLLPTADGIGFPLHVLDQQARVVRSFGVSDPRFYPGLTSSLGRRLAVARGGFLWAARTNSIVIEQWTLTGEKRLETRATRDWFQDWGVFRPPSHADPPLPELTALREDTSGLLWVVYSVPDADWRRGVGEVDTRSMHGVVWHVVDHTQAYDTVIELLNPRTGEPVSSTRVPQHVRNFVDDGEVFSYQETGDGIPTLDVWRLRWRDATGRRD